MAGQPRGAGEGPADSAHALAIATLFIVGLTALLLARGYSGHDARPDAVAQAPAIVSLSGGDAASAGDPGTAGAAPASAAEPETTPATR